MVLQNVGVNLDIINERVGRLDLCVVDRVGQAKLCLLLSWNGCGFPEPRLQKAPLGRNDADAISPPATSLLVI